MPYGPAYEQLRSSLQGIVKRDEPLARHTTYRIGGPASLYVECDTIADLGNAVSIFEAEGIEWTTLGKGSNVLASDDGYHGAVLVLGRDFRKHSIGEDHLLAGAGAVLATLVQAAFREGLSGLEFAVGIPGTLGGALAMNAGSRDDWIGEVVESVTLYEPGRGLVALRGSEVPWSYRRSGLADRGVIVEAVLRLVPGDAERIRRVMEGSLVRRKASQPLGLPNAGSVFVNPPGESAGRLIEACGLKGARVGGAQISEVHANFIVNTGSATASDVIELIRLVRDSVEETHGIELRPEVKFLGSTWPA